MGEEFGVAVWISSLQAMLDASASRTLGGTSQMEGSQVPFLTLSSEPQARVPDFTWPRCSAQLEETCFPKL